MPQPVGNGAQINAGLEQMDSRAVTETVWMNTLGFKGWHLFCGAGEVPGQNQPHAKSRQAIAPMIAKKRAVIVGIPARITEVLFHQLDGFRPERADALFTPPCRTAARWEALPAENRQRAARRPPAPVRPC